MKRRIRIDGEVYDQLNEIAKDNDIDDVSELGSALIDKAISTGGMVSTVIDEEFDEEDEADSEGA